MALVVSTGTPAPLLPGRRPGSDLKGILLCLEHRCKKHRKVSRTDVHCKEHQRGSGHFALHYRHDAWWSGDAGPCGVTPSRWVNLGETSTGGELRSPTGQELTSLD